MRLWLMIVALALAAACASSGSLRPAKGARSLGGGAVERRLYLLHTADMEAELVSTQPGVGGIGRFRSLVEALLRRGGAQSLFVAAGDTFMPGPALQVWLDGENATAVANASLGLHASALGNHEFDLGESFLAEMIAQAPFPYLTATIDFVEGPLAPLAVPVPLDAEAPWLEHYPGRLLPRGKRCAGILRETQGGPRCDGLVVGLIGATTETLASVASIAPTGARSVDSFEAVLERVQEQADALAAEGIDVVILLSHLQDVRKEIALVEGGLRGVDVIVAGGGDDRLASREHRLLPGDEAAAVCAKEDGCFPIVRAGGDGKAVLIVSAEGQYRYLGLLELGFDGEGAIVELGPGSRPWPVDERSAEVLGATPHERTRALEERVREATAPLLEEIARATVFLNGEREDVRNEQTNLGDLSADSIAWAARELAGEGAPPIDFALRNGGGIRASIGSVDQRTLERKGGPIRLLDIEAALRFDNAIVVMKTTHRALKETLEAALRGVGTTRGHFPQVSAEVSLVYDPAGVEQVQPDGGGAIERPGQRVIELSLRGEGRAPLVIVREGRLLTPDQPVRIAIPDYLARGGDGYFPVGGDEVEGVYTPDGPLTEQGSLRWFLEQATREGSWRGGAAYRVPIKGEPRTYTRIRAVDAQ